MLQVPDYEAVVDTSPYPFLLLAPDLTIIDVNKAYLHTTGRRRGDLIGRKVFDAFPPDPDDPAGERELRALYRRVLTTGKPDTVTLLRYAIPLRTPHGVRMVERYWNVVITPMLGARGEVTLLVKNSIDVTELYRMKNALRLADVIRGFRFRAERNTLSRPQALEEANRVLDEELKHLHRLFEQAPGFAAVVRGPQHVFELANKTYRRIAGDRELIGRPFREAFPDLEGQGIDQLLDQVFNSGETLVGHEMKAVLQPEPGGPMMEVYADFVAQPVIAPDGSVYGIFIQGHDITEHKHAQNELRISEERCKLAIEGSGDGVWDWNMQTGEVTYSKRWKEMLGYAEHEIGNTVEEWRSRLHPDDAGHTLGALNDCIEGKTPSFISEHRIRCKDGRWKWMLARGIVVSRDDKNGALRMTGMMTDISEKKQSDERIWRHANFDALTGLPNRRLFRDRLYQEVKKAHRTGSQAALLFIDLDRFKEVNDLLGHDAGDQLLRQAAKRLCACVRQSDTVARLGGDEFTVILTELDGVAHVEQIAQKILATMAEPFHLDNEVAYVSGSIGITLYPDDAADTEDLIRNADQAMYAAKNSGRNQFSYFTRSMQEQAHTRLRLAGELRNALSAGQLKVYYQPVVELSTGRIVKAEALLRWYHPGFGTVDPSQFIPLAEESGIIGEIGDWVFKQAVLHAQRWSAQQGVPFQIGVNRSPVQFLSRVKEIDWAGHLQVLGLSTDCIAVEIKEGLLLNAPATVTDKLLEYHDAGIQVMVDDFGTGYSSMAYLKKFGIDYLKIDRSFVRDLVIDDIDRAIAESTIAMAHRLGLRVVAEGIETAEQEELLVAAGCDFGQGFFYARAAPPEEFERMLANGAVH